MAGALSISHLPSYRATIAASELQHFTPSSAREGLTLETGPLGNDIEPLQLDGRRSRIATSRIVSPTHQFWSADLWFRPPPPF
jgi:hypothetical protein